MDAQSRLPRHKTLLRPQATRLVHVEAQTPSIFKDLRSELCRHRLALDGVASGDQYVRLCIVPGIMRRPSMAPLGTNPFPAPT